MLFAQCVPYHFTLHLKFIAVVHRLVCIFQLKCCGVNGSFDWKGFASEENSVPDSCCKNVTKGCGIGTMTDSDKVYQQVNRGQILSKFI